MLHLVDGCKVRFQAFNKRFDRGIHALDLFTPQVERINWRDDTCIEKLDVVSTWKGLSYAQAAELAWWHKVLNESVALMISEQLLDRYNKLSPLSQQRFQDFVSFLEEEWLCMSIDTLIDEMILNFFHSMESAEEHRSWLAGTGDLNNALYNVVLCHSGLEPLPGRRVATTVRYSAHPMEDAVLVISIEIDDFHTNCTFPGFRIGINHEIYPEERKNVYINHFYDSHGGYEITEDCIISSPQMPLKYDTALHEHRSSAGNHSELSPLECQYIVARLFPDSVRFERVFRCRLHLVNGDFPVTGFTAHQPVSVKGTKRRRGPSAVYACRSPLPSTPFHKRRLQAETPLTAASLRGGGAVVASSSPVTASLSDLTSIPSDIWNEGIIKGIAAEYAQAQKDRARSKAKVDDDNESSEERPSRRNDSLWSSPKDRTTWFKHIPPGEKNGNRGCTPSMRKPLVVGRVRSLKQENCQQDDDELSVPPASCKAATKAEMKRLQKRKLFLRQSSESSASSEEGYVSHPCSLTRQDAFEHYYEGLPDAPASYHKSNNLERKPFLKQETIKRNYEEFKANPTALPKPTIFDLEEAKAIEEAFMEFEYEAEDVPTDADNTVEISLDDEEDG